MAGRLAYCSYSIGGVTGSVICEVTKRLDGKVPYRMTGRVTDGVTHW
jgi:hypothetical protein